jgi:hypothetical protein
MNNDTHPILKNRYNKNKNIMNREILMLHYCLISTNYCQPKLMKKLDGRVLNGMENLNVMS